MEIADLIEIALAKIDPQRVEMAALEPVVVSTEAVGGIANIISELVDNSAKFSDDDEKVRVTGLVEPDGYLISVSDNGVGMSQERIAALNSLLEEPSAFGNHHETTLGIYLVAGLAVRHGISVRLVPGVPGVTARVSIPAGLIEDSDLAIKNQSEPPTSNDSAEAPSSLSELYWSTRRTVDTAPAPVGPNGEGETALFGYSDAEDRDDQSQGRQAFAATTKKNPETQAFLERVFAPLMKKEPDLPKALINSSTPTGRVIQRETDPVISVEAVEADSGKPLDLATLQMRAPGESFSESEDDRLNTKAGEGAVDIKSALSDYDKGRRAAEQTDHLEDGDQ